MTKKSLPFPSKFITSQIEGLVTCFLGEASDKGERDENQSGFMD